MRASSPDVAAAEPAPAVAEWRRERLALEAALSDRESAQTLERLARLCWLLDDMEAAVQAGERAYRLYRDADDHRGAARIACRLARQAAIRGEQAVFNGWTERARRLLSGVDACAEHALLAVHQSFFAFLVASDPESAHSHAATARDLARRFGLIDVEMLALAIEGASLVASGELARGMASLDEATAAALGGEMHEVELISQTCCFMIYACERARDFDRAGQWCVQMKAFCERAGLGTLTAVCRTHYATVLTERGQWGEAESELIAAGDQLAGRPTQAAEAIARLGELRRMQGRFQEAAELLERVAFHPRAQLAHAALCLKRGDPEDAIRWLERFLRQVPASDRTQRAVAFELLTRARSAMGDIAAAMLALAELEAVAGAVDSELMRAAVAFTKGVVESKNGNLDAASRCLEDAVDRYERCGLPFEAAESRMALSDVLRELGHSLVAGRELRQARETFERLGATLASKESESTLTAREVEVLRLIADGLSDHGIAERLVLSPHTVHRHVSNILVKLEETSRSAAVAHAVRAGLL